MAGNPEHEDALRKAYPDAESVECDGGPGGWATLTYADGASRQGKCPGCERDRIAAEIRSVIPPRFRFNIDIPEAVIKWCKLGRKAEGLYLTGPVGTGKTHTAWMTVTNWCYETRTRPRPGVIDDWGTASAPPLIFTRMTDLLDDLRPGDHARTAVRNCQNTQLLVIDDLGAEKASEWTQERLYSVIDERYSRRMPLIVTGNLPPSKVADQTGERVASRLAEMCTVVPMTGTDRRRPAA